MLATGAINLACCTRRIHPDTLLEMPAVFDCSLCHDVIAETMRLLLKFMLLASMQ